MADDHGCVGSSRAARRLDCLEDATRSLLDISPELWLTTCTSGSLIDSFDGECRIRDSILAAGTPRALTTSGPMLRALAALRAHRIAVGKPHDEACTNALGAFLGAAGHEGVSLVQDEPRPDSGLTEYIEADLADLPDRAYRPDARHRSCAEPAPKPIIAGLRQRLLRVGSAG